MNVKTLIIDDSCHDLKIIQDVFQSIMSDSHCDCVTKIPDNIEKLHYDIYILDIDMPEMNGFELARKITSNNAEAVIMFCTNHNELVFQSFQFHTFYFIRKDSIHSDMLEALHKYQNECRQQNKFYVLSSNHQMLKVSYKMIVFFEVSGNELTIKTVKQEYHERKTMKELLNEIPGSMFFQISRSMLINLAFIRSISKDHVILQDGRKLEVVHSRIKELKNAYLEALL